MPDRPTFQHVRLSGVELGGRPIEIKSAELVYIQHWNEGEPAQRDWEVNGRTEDDGLREGVQPVVIVTPNGRFKGRVVVNHSRSYGMTVWQGVGLGDLTPA
jgi:hypothetical protein